MTQYAPYPPQYPPAAPVYPPAPQYAPAPQYGPPPMPGYPPVQYAPPVAPLAQGSIDDFYSQPSTGGGAFLKFEHPGQTYAGFLARPIAQGDIRQVTTPPAQGSVPQIYRDGRPKFEMLVPLKMQPDAGHPDGLGTWPVRGGDREELTRAMAEAGAPEGPPEYDAQLGGCFIQITFTHTEPTRGGIPRKVKRITYARPGQTPTLQQPMVQYVPAAPQPQYQPAPAAPAPTYAPTAVPPVQYVTSAPAVQYVAPPVQPPAAVPLQAPADMTPDQQALLARLTGQTAG